STPLIIYLQINLKLDAPLQRSLKSSLSPFSPNILSTYISSKIVASFIFGILHLLLAIFLVTKKIPLGAKAPKRIKAI
ncbi:MAG: hypothetical protein KAU91_00630, partial [Candidatus Aminicenantes bacterium]|nr:hypothetical protein [Candidatus Aminicenantes bacterium]